MDAEAKQPERMADRALIDGLRQTGTRVFGCNQCGTTFDHDPVIFTGAKESFFFCADRCRQAFQATGSVSSINGRRA